MLEPDKPDASTWLMSSLLQRRLLTILRVPIHTTSYTVWSAQPVKIRLASIR